MRIWSIPPRQLCNWHLLAQHNESHSIYNIISQKYDGYRNHPEVKRWRGYENALAFVHANTEQAMKERGMRPCSPIPVDYDQFIEIPPSYQPVAEQMEILKAKQFSVKNCDCYKNYREEYWMMVEREEAEIVERYMQRCGWEMPGAKDDCGDYDIAVETVKWFKKQFNQGGNRDEPDSV